MQISFNYKKLVLLYISFGRTYQADLLMMFKIKDQLLSKSILIGELFAALVQRLLVILSKKSGTNLPLGNYAHTKLNRNLFVLFVAS